MQSDFEKAEVMARSFKGVFLKLILQVAYRGGETGLRKKRGEKGMINNSKVTQRCFFLFEREKRGEGERKRWRRWREPIRMKLSNAIRSGEVSLSVRQVSPTVFPYPRRTCAL